MLLTLFDKYTGNNLGVQTGDSGITANHFIGLDDPPDWPVPIPEGEVSRGKWSTSDNAYQIRPNNMPVQLNTAYLVVSCASRFGISHPDYLFNGRQLINARVGLRILIVLIRALSCCKISVLFPLSRRARSLLFGSFDIA